MRYLVGNWKSNKTFEQTYQWFDQFAQLYKPLPELTVVVAVPFPFIPEAKKKITELGLRQVHIAAQDVSPFPFGAYTGAVSAQMLVEYVDYAIVGHSERRKHFAETHLEIANKVTQLHQVGITPIMCIDEPYAQKQLAILEENDLNNLIIAYEPLAAIGTGNPDEPEHVQEVTQHIQSLLNNEAIPIIYGGSTNEINAHTYLGIDGISGLLPGGSSLKPEIFAQMAQAFA